MKGSIVPILFEQIALELTALIGLTQMQVLAGVIAAITIFLFAEPLQGLIIQRIAWMRFLTSDRLARVRYILRAFIRMAPIAFLAQAAASEAPLISLLTSLLAIIFIRNWIQDLAIGAHIQLGHLIRVGSDLQVGDIQGRVRDFGLCHLILENTAGATVMVRHKLLTENAYTVGESRRSRTVVVEAPIPRIETDLLDQIRDELLLSPYRDAGSELIVLSRCSGDSALVEIHFQPWPSLTEARVRNHLLHNVERVARRVTNL